MHARSMPVVDSRALSIWHSQWPINIMAASATCIRGRLRNLFSHMLTVGTSTPQQDAAMLIRCRGRDAAIYGSPGMRRPGATASYCAGLQDLAVPSVIGLRDDRVHAST